MEEERNFDKEKEVDLILISRGNDIGKEIKGTETKIKNIKKRKNINKTGKINIFQILFLG